MPTSLPRRALALSAAIATAAVALVTFPAIALAPASTAIADNPSCISPVADVPNVHGQVYGPAGSQGFYGIDPEVGVYIAGDWNVLPGAAEAEGTIVVGGSASFNSADYFNLGTVGLGSQVSAGPGTDMLTTGGNVAVGTTTTLEVGNNRGGNIVAGGIITPTVPTPKIALNGGSATAGVTDALLPSASIPTYYQGLSASYSALPADGTVTSDANSVTFVGTGASRQVFSVDGSVLGTIAAPKSIDFTGIASDALVVVNVTGATAAMSSWGYSMNGAPLDFAAAEPDRVFSGWSQSIAWNFPTATSVTLGLNGQLPGAVLVPTAGSTLDLRTSINGRLYVNGTVNFGGPGTTGLEIHNYPLRSVCATATGSFTIAKSINDPDAAALATRTYTGTYSCVDSLGSSVGSGTWSLLAGDSVTVPDLPVGSACSATEDPATLAASPSASDPTYTWATPSYSAASVTVAASSPVTITVQNAVLQGVGILSITKTLDDPDGVVAAGRVFSGSYECRAGSVLVASGSWATTAGGTASVVTGIPAPSSCAIAENSLGTPPSATDASYQWVTPTYSPAATVGITDGSTTGVVVQNEVRRGLGDLEMIKILDDPYDVVNLDRVYTGTWSCTFGGVQIEGGAWSTTAGAAPLTLATDIPVGSTCTLAEDAATLAAPPLAGFPQYIWREPVISPATVSILEGVVHRFTVTNIVYDPIAVLAHSGTDSVLPIVIGAGIVGAGILFLLIARRRRVASRR